MCRPSCASVTTSGKLYRYYVSQTILKHGAGTCEIGRVPAGEIEAAVVNQLRTVFRQPEIVAGTWKESHAQDGEITEGDAREPPAQKGCVASSQLAHMALCFTLLLAARSEKVCGAR